MTQIDVSTTPWLPVPWAKSQSIPVDVRPMHHDITDSAGPLLGVRVMLQTTLRCKSWSCVLHFVS